MYLWPLSAALVLVGAAFLNSCLAEHAVAFKEVDEAWTSVRSAGFECASDRANADAANGFLVSRSPVTFEEICHFCKAGPMGPDWKGKVWVTMREGLQGTPEGAGVRIWGRLIAFGDNELLDEIEHSLKQRSH
jgi:hypothetical protein